MSGTTLVPEVPEDVCKRLLDAIPRDPEMRKRRLFGELDRMEKTNPQISRLLRNSIGSNTQSYVSARDELVWTAYGGVLVFQLLDTVMQIPPITRDTCEGLLVEHRRIIQTGQDATNRFLEEVARGLKVENKFLLQALHRLAQECRENQAKLLVFYNGVTVYQLIKSKIESDILDQKFFPED